MVPIWDYVYYTVSRFLLKVIQGMIILAIQDETFIGKAQRPEANLLEQMTLYNRGGLHRLVEGDTQLFWLLITTIINRSTFMLQRQPLFTRLINQRPGMGLCSVSARNMIRPDEQAIARFVEDIAKRKDSVGRYSAGNQRRLTPL